MEQQYGRWFFKPLLIIAVFFGNAHADDTAEIRMGILTDKNGRAPCEIVAQRAASLILSGRYEEWQVAREWSAVCESSDELKLYRLSQTPDGTDELPINRDLYTRIALSRAARPVSMGVQLAALLALTARATAPTTTDGRLVRAWLTDGFYVYEGQLKTATTGKFREFYNENLIDRADGFSYVLAVTGGLWSPSANLARLGDHASAGFLLSFGLARFYLGMAFDLRFGEAASRYAYYNPNSNSIATTRTFYSLFFGPDLRYEFARSGCFSFLVATGLGYDVITHYTATRYSGEKQAQSDSLNLNAGLALRWYWNEERTAFVDLEAKRHFVEYNNGGRGGDDLSGGYTTILFGAGLKLLAAD